MDTYLPRENDIFLMDYFVRKHYKPNEMKQLNQCQIYLQVLTLTDICSADGTHIAIPIYKGLQLIDRKSKLNWPEQQCPSTAAWKLWKVALLRLEKESIH